jgi:hypothetical protein
LLLVLLLTSALTCCCSVGPHVCLGMSLSQPSDQPDCTVQIMASAELTLLLLLLLLLTSVPMLPQCGPSRVPWHEPVLH